MEKRLRKTAHGVYSYMLHLVLVTKYRHPIFLGISGSGLKDIIRQVCIDLGYDVEVMNDDVNHVHILLNLPVFVSPLDVVKDVKAISAIMAWEDYADYLRKFYKKTNTLWSEGYCVVSTGGAGADDVEKYIKNQGLK